MINAAWYHQRCIISSTLHHVINAVLYHQRYIISSTLDCIINAALYHQCCSNAHRCCILSSTLHCIIDAALYHQCCINARQCCILSSMLHYIINAALYHQRFIISSMMHYTANAELHHSMQSCIREFCPSTNPIYKWSVKNLTWTMMLLVFPSSFFSFFDNIIRDVLLIRCLFLLSITVGNSDQGLG